MARHDDSCLLWVSRREKLQRSKLDGAQWGPLRAGLCDEVLMSVHVGCAGAEVGLGAGAVGVRTLTPDILQITPNKRQ